jgi:RNA polymerase sigma-70 factor (ECF subfamily)
MLDQRSRSLLEEAEKGLKMACAAAFRLVHDYHLAEDLAADALLAVWRLYKKGRFDPSRGRFSTLVVSIVLRRARTAYGRRQEMHARIMPCVDLANLAAGSKGERSGRASPLETAEGEAGWARFLAALEQALLRLSPRLRAVFELRHLEGKSTKETADALGLTQNAVRQMSHKALKALAEDEALHRAASVFLDL